VATITDASSIPRGIPVEYVNGLTGDHARKSIRGIRTFLLPDFVAVAILVGLGMDRLLRYLEPKGRPRRGFRF